MICLPLVKRVNVTIRSRIVRKVLPGPHATRKARDTNILGSVGFIRYGIKIQLIGFVFRCYLYVPRPIVRYEAAGYGGLVTTFSRV